MSPVQRSKPSRYSFTLFKRSAKTGETILYARIIDTETGAILAQRSTGTSDERKAAAKAGQLLAELPLEALSKAREANASAELAEADRLRDLMLSRYFTQFWAEGSTYLAAKSEAGKPLSRMYIHNQQSAVTRFAAEYPPFQRTPVKSASLILFESFRDHLRTKGVTANTRNAALNALRSPVSWAQKRGLVDVPFDFSGIERPKTTYRKRGVLTSAEVAKIVALPVAPVWEEEVSGKVHVDARPRPRLAAGKEHECPAPIDLRQKAAVLLSELAGLRRGEIRALKWGAVDLERGQIEVLDNYVPIDGAKTPKTGSVGTVPISEDLGEVLKKLKEVAKKLKLDSPARYVLMGATPDIPINPITISRGYRRALLAIGITDEMRKQRNLVPHSGRHGFATRLADEIGERAASRLTRHRSSTAFEGYASHTSEEILEKGRQALKLEKRNGGVAQ